MARKKQWVEKNQNATSAAASAREQYSTAMPASTRTPGGNPKTRPTPTQEQKKNEGRKAQAEKIAALEAEIAMLKAKGLGEATTVARGGGEIIGAQERGVWQPNTSTQMGTMTLPSRASAPNGPSVKDFRDQFLHGNIGNGITGIRLFSAPHVLAKHNPVKEKGTKQSDRFVPSNKSANPRSGTQATSKKQKKTAIHWWQTATGTEYQPRAVITARPVEDAEAIPRFNGPNESHPTSSSALTIGAKASPLIPVTGGRAAPWTGGVDQFPGVQHLHPNQSEKIHEPLGNKTTTSARQLLPPVQHVVANEPTVDHQHGQTFRCNSTTPGTPGTLPPSFSGTDQGAQHGNSVAPWPQKHTAMNMRLPAATNSPDVSPYVTGTHAPQAPDGRSPAPLKPLPPRARSQDLDPYTGPHYLLQSYNERTSGQLDAAPAPARISVIQVRNQPPVQPNSNAGLSLVEHAIQEARQRMGYTSPAAILRVVVPQSVPKYASVTAKRHFEPEPNRNLGPPASRKRRKKVDGSGNAQTVPGEFVDLTIDVTEEDHGLILSAKKSRNKLISPRMSDSHRHQLQAPDDLTVPEIDHLQSAKGITTAASTDALLRMSQKEGVMKYWNLEYYPDLREDGRLKYE